MTKHKRFLIEALEDRITPAAGDLDPAFGTTGMVHSAAGPVSELALVPDGRILSLQGTGSVARFRPDGNPDTTFGAGGVAAVPGFTDTMFGSALAALPVVAGVADPGLSAENTGTGVNDPGYNITETAYARMSL